MWNFSAAYQIARREQRTELLPYAHYICHRNSAKFSSSVSKFRTPQDDGWLYDESMSRPPDEGMLHTVHGILQKQSQ